MLGRRDHGWAWWQRGSSASRWSRSCGAWLTSEFKNGRGFAAWLGITPRQHSSGGKERLGQITRQGDTYLRTLLVHGARAYLRVVDKKTDAKSDWARRRKERRHVNVVAVALAAKHARIARAILAHGTSYRPTKPEMLAA
jgi:transposase